MKRPISCITLTAIAPIFPPPLNRHPLRECPPCVAHTQHNSTIAHPFSTTARRFSA
ncbi:hypothetical protein BJ165DRAFT_1516980 [Panaeolus papilionaceus]|nr:hypothetical protein BJ165DRAFT_1516980 [Panaeolus papilionaceus]